MATATTAKTPGQLFALVFGVVYIVVGLAGFAVTGLDDFAKDTGEKLILFGVNPLHNIIHLAVGALWVAGSRTVSGAKTVNTLIGVVYLLFGVLGLVGLLDLINHNAADAGLHFVSGAVALFFGTIGGRAVTTA